MQSTRLTTMYPGPTGAPMTRPVHDRCHHDLYLLYSVLSCLMHIPLNFFPRLFIKCENKIQHMEYHLWIIFNSLNKGHFNSVNTAANFLSIARSVFFQTFSIMTKQNNKKIASQTIMKIAPKSA